MATEMSQPDARFLEEVWTRLYSVMELQGAKDMFVKEADLKLVWKEVPTGQQQSRLGLLVQNLYDPPPDDATAAKWLSSLESRFLKVISILVYISWDKWRDFLQIFVGYAFDPTTADQKHRADSDLPFADRASLTSDSFLGPKYGLSFYDYQYIFIPIKIGNWLVKEDNHSIKTLRFRTRLPVLHTKEIGYGASGKVFVETIASGYFRIEDGWNTKPKQIARKAITTQDKFDVETGNLMQIQSCLSTHSNIAKCYDMVVRQSAHKTRYDIFYELASFDLRKLFNGPLDSGDGYRTYKKENPGHFEGIEFWHLLQQAGCLADALHHLHEESYHPDEGKVCLAHNDLKPDNILVFYQPGSPVGTWKIADLGLSRIKSGIREDSVEQDSPSCMGQLNLQQPAARFAPTYAKRPPGAYTAPESQKRMRVDPIQGDIWSFGCILSEILAFAIGGTQTLREFNVLRYDRNDRFYERCDQSPTGYRLKKKVFNWLSNIHVRYPTVGIWATECVDLIFHILGVHDANANSRHGTTGWILFLDKRPKAREIRDTIGLIRQTERRRQSLQKTLSLPTTSAPDTPESGPSAPSINVTPPESHRPEQVTPTQDSTQDSTEVIPVSDEPGPDWSKSDTARITENRAESSNHSTPNNEISAADVSYSAADSDTEKTNRSMDKLSQARIESRYPSFHDPLPESSSASAHSGDSDQIATDQPPTPPTSISRGTSISSWGTGLCGPKHSSFVKVLDRGMPNTKISPNAKYVAFWSDNKAVFFCLASLDFATGNDADHSMRCEISRPGSLKCEAIAFWGDQLAITYRGGGAVEIRFYDLSIENNKCCAKLHSVLSHVDLSDLVEVILGTEGARVLHLSSSVRVGNSSRTYEQYRKMPMNDALGDVSMTADGKWLMAWSWSPRPNKEHWQVWELSASQTSNPTKTEHWPMAHSDTDRDASPTLTIRLQNAIAKYYRTGNTIMFDKDRKSAIISQLPREVIAACGVPGQDTMLYITAGTILRGPSLQQACIRSTPRGLALEPQTSDVYKMSKSWKKRSVPSIAVGTASSSGSSIPLVFISNTDGRVDRIPIKDSLAI